MTRRLFERSGGMFSRSSRNCVVPGDVDGRGLWSAAALWSGGGTLVVNVLGTGRRGDRQRDKNERDVLHASSG
jgi:hypothetical protein